MSQGAPASFDAANVTSVHTLYDQLEVRAVETRESLEALIRDWDELECLVREQGVEAYVAMTLDTRDPDRQARFSGIVRDLIPVLEQRGAALKRKVLGSAAVTALGPVYLVYLQHLRAEIDLFREVNVPLRTREIALQHEFQAIAGAQQGEFQGQTLTMQQLFKFLEEPDRDVREGAWRTLADAHVADSDRLDDLFDQLLEVRRDLAGNAGLTDFREYAFQWLNRFHYGPDDCLRLCDAIERHVVPVAAAERQRRRERLGIDRVRPWDLSVDPDSKSAPRPFQRVKELEERCERIFLRIDPQLGALFARLRTDGLLDTENRPGKAPGCYMNAFTHRRVPFIFMNAVGSPIDVWTLLHEAGHAFHYLLARDQPLAKYRLAPLEFAEVASTAMELLARPHLDEFYAGEELGRMADQQFYTIMEQLCRYGKVEAFQHWLYLTPDAPAEARREKWTELDERFRPGVDWTGLEEYRGVFWQGLHVFVYPFYNIEYVIAQLAALGIWMRSLDDPEAALADYKRALALGGSRPLPDLFRAAGVDLAFDERTVEERVRRTLSRLRLTTQGADPAAP